MSEDSLTYLDSDEIPILDRQSDDGTMFDGEKAVVKGWSFDELVDRLLAPHVTKLDQEFVITFLLVFRRFATPSELLGAIIGRFEAVEEEEEDLNRLEAQIRYVLILHQWVTTHPGDCTAPRTRKRLMEFLAQIGKDREFAYMTTEIFEAFNSDVQDEDLDWARPEPEDDDRAAAAHGPSPQSPQKKPPRVLQVPRSFADPIKRASEISYDSISSSNSSQGYPKIAEPIPKPMFSMYDAFMNLTVQEIADELTRIDWTDLSKISARQVIRHQSLSLEARSKVPQLEPLNNIIQRFNHIASWVGKVVLERAKPKYRARALEKFMEVAWVSIFASSL